MMYGRWVAVSDRTWDVLILEEFESIWVSRVADFFNSNFPGIFGDICQPEFFRWKLGQLNPAGKGILALAVSGSDVVGVVTANMKLAVLDEQTLCAAEIGDAFTHPDFRRSGRSAVLAEGTDDFEDYLNKSIFGRLLEEITKRLAERGVELVYTTPNDQSQSRSGFSRRGKYVEISQLGSRSWHRPCKTFLKNRLPLRSGVVVNKIIDVATSVIRPNRGYRTVVESVALTSDTELDDFYKAVDDIWSQQKLKGKFTLVQNSDYLAHRYSAHPSRPFFGHLIKLSDSPVGFFVTRRISRTDGHLTLCIADWLFVPDLVPDLFPLLIYNVVSNAVGVDTVSLWVNDQAISRKKLLRLGFLPRSKVRVLLGVNELGHYLESSNHSWTMPIGWSDNV